MRLLFSVLLVLLFIAIGGFLANNLDAVVTLNVWNTIYEDLHIGYVVILSIVVGVVFASIFAIVEGAKTRLECRALRRENQRLENEIGYLRTQPPPGPRPEPDALDSEARPRGSAGEGTQSGGKMATAPVYGTEKNDWPPDPDDDVYTGGTAV